jgi:anti-sigma regulatory factor (Ser/Thr protein kinase)
LSDIAAYVLNAARAAGLDTTGSYRLRLAVDELATNIVVHGYVEAGQQGQIWVHALIDAQELTITLEDTGVPFDPRAYPVEDQFDRSLADRQPGGLGIYLALKGVDSFSYVYAAGRNHNSLTMRRPAP